MFYGMLFEACSLEAIRIKSFTDDGMPYAGILILLPTLAYAKFKITFKVTKEPFHIKEDKNFKIGWILLSVIAIIAAFFVKLDDGKTNFQNSPIASTIISVIAIIVIFVKASSIINDSSEIILTTQGIDFSGTKSFNCEDIRSFEIIYYRSSDNSELELTFFLVNDKKKTFRIDNLEIGAAELAGLILLYSETHGVVYLGYKEI